MGAIIGVTINLSIDMDAPVIELKDEEIMSKLFKMAMFFTSFTPLWLSVVFLNAVSLIENKQNLITEIVGTAAIAVSMLMSLVVIICTIRGVKKTDYRSYCLKSASQERGITSEFLLSYILPLFAFDFTEWIGMAQFLIYFSVLAFLCIRNNNVYINLLFELKRYKFYSCTVELNTEDAKNEIQALVISRENLVSRQGNTVRIAPLNKPFFISE